MKPPNYKKLEAGYKDGAHLEKGWVLANHILVSFHVAFISSVLSLPLAHIFKTEVLTFIFRSPETAISALFMYISFHTGVAIHEMGHFLEAGRIAALNRSAQEEFNQKTNQGLVKRIFYYAKMFILTPYGKALGIKREGLNYYPDAPYNLAVAANGPKASRNASLFALPLAIMLLYFGLHFNHIPSLYVGRLCLGIGLVTLLDFFIADPGKYREFREREEKAKHKAEMVEKVSDWYRVSQSVKQRMLEERIQKAVHPSLGNVEAPWQFRNCGMGGRHTEKEYPESNISMQEGMFVILGAPNYEEAQEMTVKLQNRLKEIIEKGEGCRVMGIGLEGGLAPYIEKGGYPLPELRLWTMMKQSIEECGYKPGADIAIALDPAMSELQNAYREEYNMPDSVGTYLFWRDKARVIFSRDQVLEIYRKAIQEYEIPIISIEDGFAEDDYQGWQMLLEELGDRILVIGDDLVTTNDKTIEMSASQHLINTALIKANQIGTLYETILAVLVALGKNLELVVSHRSKSPNDDMEAQVALAVNALGLKAGGGANTERLVKYQKVLDLMNKLERGIALTSLKEGAKAIIRNFTSCEEPTNAGIPTVGVEVQVYSPETQLILEKRGATPLGTSAGAGEAIHLIDSLIEYAEYKEVADRHSDLFQKVEEGTYEFKKGVSESQVRETRNEKLIQLFAKSERYEGKGCLNAAENVVKIIAPKFEGKDLASLSLRDIDKTLLDLEREAAVRNGKLSPEAKEEAQVLVMQRKGTLGMNAILSVSLALARALSHIKGKELYELLREEMLSIVGGLAQDYNIAIEGREFSDYTRALRQVNGILEEQGKALYECLREQTGIYKGDSSLP